MRYARPRKHYRAAEQEAKSHVLKGTFIPEEDKPKLAICAVILSVMVFLMGLFLGAASND